MKGITRFIAATGLLSVASFVAANAKGTNQDTTTAVTNNAIEVIDNAITADSLATLRKDFKVAQSVGLVLSGGGAKGIAHIGVIKALEEHDIPIDYIAGTSMGAIVGGLYAAGYTPEEMIDLILSKGFSSWSSGQIDPTLTYYFLRQPQTPAFAHLNVNINRNDSLAKAHQYPQSLINPLPMNFAFMDLFAAYTAQCGGDFNRLFVPFRCVTSDVIHKHKIVMRDGLLSNAIRASMSFPAVFAPIKVNGVYVYDGGIYDNFPVDVMREDFAPDIMLGVDVHAENVPSSNSIMTQLENMIIQNNDYTLPADEGIRIHVDVSQFSLLDWGKAREIYAKGYERAMEMMDSIEGRVHSRIPSATRQLRRAVFKSQTPYVRFDSVNVTGGTMAQNEYISDLFERSSKADTFGIEKARMAYYRAITPGKLRNLQPQASYNAQTGLFTLNLDADVKNNFSLGAGGYLTSSVNSMIFVSADYSRLSFSSWSSRLMGWIGQSYMAAQFDGALNFTRNIPSALRFEAVVARQKYYENDKLFYQDNSPDFISRLDMFGRVEYAWALGRSGKASVGISGGSDRYKFYSSGVVSLTDARREETRMDLGQALLRIEYNTLNNNSFPSSGARIKVVGMQTLGKYHHYYPKGDDMPTVTIDQHWFQAEADAIKYFTIGKKFSIGTGVNVLVSNRPLLDTYYASVVNAPGFSPMTSMADVFNEAFHANSYAAATLTPIWMPFNNAQVRLSGNVFVPFRRIERAADGVGAVHGKWFNKPQYIAELDLVYNLPFASICGYANYLSSPARNWNLGLSFGLYFTADEFLR